MTMRSGGSACALYLAFVTACATIKRCPSPPWRGSWTASGWWRDASRTWSGEISTAPRRGSSPRGLCSQTTSLYRCGAPVLEYIELATIIGMSQSNITISLLFSV